jgi:MFS family permease
MSESIARPRRARLALYTLFGASAVSLTGNRLTALAIPWFVLSTTGSAVQTGISAFFTILPTVLAAFFGGSLVDRLGFKRTSVLSDVASGVAVALIPLLYGLGLLPFWMLLVLVFCGALLDAPGGTARHALLPELATAAGMPLERASALAQVVERGSLLVGAPLGGLLIAALGAQHVLWLDAATFALSALSVALLVPNMALPRRAEPQPYLENVLEGLRYIRKDRLTRVLVLIILITNFLDAAKSSVIMPVFAERQYGSAIALGLIFGLSGGGAVVGALIYSAIGHRLSRRWVFVCTFITVSLPILVLALLPPLPVVLALQAVSGLAAGPINPILSTIQYERVPAEMRGRVFGAITAGCYAAMPLGVLLAGFLLEGVGLQLALLITGGCYLLTTGSMLFNGALRDMDRRPGDAPAASEDAAQQSSHAASSS